MMAYLQSHSNPKDTRISTVLWIVDFAELETLGKSTITSKQHKQILYFSNEPTPFPKEFEKYEIDL